ncbi:hypothetical protein OCK74_02970 [Chitinophagaceae bacterium LB-8]|uniref:Uncharacterized protein n=1 Tax=Paraflavisolibacter caeni TaxID=2982496 RepID=A0A9X2XTG5_9BACT|nr:hypothetical protein [Paraflavisolibacter caeni]MCU7548056.1 hypothetical protein [Paraflavisolibacter caeni]
MKFFYLPLFIVVISFCSCRKDVQKPGSVSNLPDETATLLRKFTYPASNTADSVSFVLSRDSIKISGSNNTGKQLILAVDIPYPQGNDYIKFTINEGKLKPGLVGAYTIVSSPVGGLQGDAQVNYRYKKDTYSYVEFYPGNADGVLQFTSYDPGQKLLAGTYSFHINSLHNPKIGMNWVETRIDVKGSFGNMQIK